MHKHSKGFSSETKLIFVCFGIIILVLTIMFCNMNRTDYYTIANKYASAEIINSCDLTIEELQNRNGKLIIERVIGQVDNFITGAGHILDNPNYYISYAGMEGIANGNIICSYMIYNPDNNYEDDIIMRFDYVIDARTIEYPEMENIFDAMLSDTKCK